MFTPVLKTSMGMMAITGVIGLVGVLVNDSLVPVHTLNEKRRELGVSNGNEHGMGCYVWWPGVFGFTADTLYGGTGHSRETIHRF